MKSVTFYVNGVKDPSLTVSVPGSVQYVFTSYPRRPYRFFGTRLAETIRTIRGWR
jgi:hypothetical protein